LKYIARLNICVVKVGHYLMSVALTSIENVGVVKQCFIEINLSSAECVTESNHSREKCVL